MHTFLTRFFVTLLEFRLTLILGYRFVFFAALCFPIFTHLLHNIKTRFFFSVKMKISLLYSGNIVTCLNLFVHGCH